MERLLHSVTMAADGEPSGIRGRIREGLRPVPLALVVFAVIEPFASFLDRNRGEYVQRVILVQLVLAALVGSAVVYVILLTVLRRAGRGRIASAQAAFVFCFFRYGDMFRYSDHTVAVRLGAWMLLTGVAVAAVALWSRHENLRLFLVLFLVITTVMPTLSYVRHELNKDETAVEAGGQRHPLPVADESVRTPDVWWLLLDGYARHDVLDAVHDFDNTPFVAGLEERGFHVSDDSYSSYPNTALSVASVLELDYAASTPADLNEGVEAVTGAFRSGGRVAEALGAHGYRYIYADNGVHDISQCDPSAVDVCIDVRPGQFQIGHLARTVADLTPLAELRSDVRPDPLWVVESAGRAMSDDQPEFVFAHLLNPHEPLWYDDDCDYRSEAVHTDFRPDRYIHQIECLNPQVLRAVDSITTADPEAIVIIQSDHGSGFLGEWMNRSKTYDDWSADALAERYSTLEAMRFPDGCVPPKGDHSNVSTFEYVLACIEGREAKPIDDRYFFWRKGTGDLIKIDRPAAIESD